MNHDVQISSDSTDSFQWYLHISQLFNTSSFGV